MTTTNTTIRTRPLLIAATIPSLLSLAWTAWSVADMIPAPAPIAIAAGIALDVMLVAAVAIAWMAPTIARGAQIASWVIAGVAAAAIALHSWHLSPALVLMAAVPLIAKALWGLALSAKTAQEVEAARVEAEEAKATEAKRVEAERKAARLSTGLTPEQEEELAQIRRQAAYARAKAAAESELTTAEADADRERQQAEAESERIRRQAESQLRQEAVNNKTEEELAVLEANARLVKRRQEVEVELELTRPYALPSGTGTRVPDDASMLQGGGPGTPGSFVASGAGFGGAMVATGAASAHMGGSDQQMPQVPGQVPGAVVHHSSAEAEVNRARVAQVFKVLEQATGEAPSIAAVARGAGVSDRAAGRHLRAAGLID